jgi:hyperosmotically inducible protein
MRRLTYSLAFALCLAAVPALPAQEAGQAPKADNTKVNKRDRKASQPTADQQKENKPDRQVAADIRKAVMDDKSLSTYAHNVKIIVQHGAVTLKGPVHSEEEKSTVVAKAKEVAGADKVTDMLTVKGDKNPKADKKKS